MSDDTSLLAILEQRLGERPVLRDPADQARYLSDWAGDRLGMPLAVVRPASTAELAEVVTLCREHGVAMTPQGGHSGLVAGALPASDGRELVISLERLNRIRDIDPVNFTMTVDAGCILETVKQAAAEHDCDFPVSLGAQGSCQIGGNIATNAGGLNVLRHGMMRQLVLGLEVVLPDGRVWNGLHALHKETAASTSSSCFSAARAPWASCPAPYSSWSRRPNKAAPPCWGCPPWRRLSISMSWPGVAAATCSRPSN